MGSTGFIILGLTFILAVTAIIFKVLGMQEKANERLESSSDELAPKETVKKSITPSEMQSRFT